MSRDYDVTPFPACGRGLEDNARAKASGRLLHHGVEEMGSESSSALPTASSDFERRLKIPATAPAAFAETLPTALAAPPTAVAAPLTAVSACGSSGTPSPSRSTLRNRLVASTTWPQTLSPKSFADSEAARIASTAADGSGTPSPSLSV